MSEALYSAFIRIEADTLGFAEQVKGAVATATDLGAPIRLNAEVNPASVASLKETIGRAATIDGSKLGASGLAAAEHARPTLIEAGRRIGEHYAEGFHEKFTERIKGTIESIGKLGVGFGAIIGGEEFFKKGIEGAENYSRSLDNLTEKLGALAPAAQKASDDTAHAFGASQEAALRSTALYTDALLNAGRTPAQAAAQVNDLNKITGQLATRANIPFDAAGEQINTFLETGQGRTLQKFLGKFTPADFQAEGEKLGLGDTKDHTRAIRDADVAKTKAQEHLDEVLAKGNPTVEQRAKLTTELSVAEANVTKAKAQAAAGRGSYQAELTANQALADVRQKIKDAYTPADVDTLAEAQAGLADATDRVTAAHTEGARVFTEEERQLIALQLLVDRSHDLGPPKPKASENIANTFSDIARKSLEQLTPSLDKFANFLSDHQDQIASDIAGAFTKVGDVFKFVVDHKTAFLDVALALGSIQLGKFVTGELQKLQDLVAVVKGGGAGSGEGVIKGLTTMTVEAANVVVNARNVVGGGGLPGGSGRGGSGPGGTLTKEEQAAEDAYNAAHPGSRDRTGLGVPPGGTPKPGEPKPGEPKPTPKPRGGTSVLGGAGGIFGGLLSAVLGDQLVGQVTSQIPGTPEGGYGLLDLVGAGGHGGQFYGNAASGIGRRVFGNQGAGGDTPGEQIRLALQNTPGGIDPYTNALNLASSTAFRDTVLGHAGTNKEGLTTIAGPDTGSLEQYSLYAKDEAKKATSDADRKHWEDLAATYETLNGLVQRGAIKTQDDLNYFLSHANDLTTTVVHFQTALLQSVADAEAATKAFIAAGYQQRHDASNTALLAANPDARTTKVGQTGKGPTSFASGGYNVDPTLAVVGDAPGGEWTLRRDQVMQSLVAEAALSGGQRGDQYGPDILAELRALRQDVRAQHPAGNTIQVIQQGMEDPRTTVADVQRGLFLGQKAQRGIGAAIGYPGDAAPGGRK